MSRRGGLSAFFILAAIGAFLWWYNRPPSIQDFSVSPEIINLGQQTTIRVLAQGAQRFQAKADAGSLANSFRPRSKEGRDAWQDE